MSFTRKYRLITITLMTIMMSHIPNVALAEELSAKKNEMIPTEVVVNDFNRQQTQNEILTYLNKDEVKQRLITNGVSPDEASARVASLSDQELQDMSKQVKQAQYGGDILFTILLVVLIIFLIKRI